MVNANGLKGESLKKIILLNGPPGSGKDAIAEILVHNCNGINLKYAQPLRNIVTSFFNINERELDDLKNKPIDKNKSNYRFRDFMIDVSENVIKPNLGQDWFAEKLVSRIKSKFYDEKLVVISDLGFLKELEVLYNGLKSFYEFELWQIYRSGKDFSKDSRKYVIHPNIKTRIINNDYSLMTLKNMILDIVKP